MLSEIAANITPKNKQVVLVRETQEDVTKAGILLPSDMTSRKMRYGIVVTTAEDSDIGLEQGMRVSYQNHAGTDMDLMVGDAKYKVVLMPQSSITAVLGNNAKLGVSDD